MLPVFPLAQDILTDPTHQGIATGGIVVGVIAGILIALGILIPPGLYLWRKARPAIQDIFGSIKTMGAASLKPDPQLIAATRDGVREALAPMADSIKELVSENKELRQTADDRAAMNVGLQDRLARLEQQSERDKQSFQAQIDGQCSTIDRLTSRINTLQETVDEQQKELARKDATITEQVAQLKELETLKAQVEALTAEVSRLKARLQMQEALELKLKQAEEARDAEKARADKLAVELQAKQNALDSANARVAELVTEVTALHKALPENRLPDPTANAPKAE